MGPMCEGPVKEASSREEMMEGGGACVFRDLRDLISVCLARVNASAL